MCLIAFWKQNSSRFLSFSWSQSNTIYSPSHVEVCVCIVVFRVQTSHSCNEAQMLRFCKSITAHDSCNISDVFLLLIALIKHFTPWIVCTMNIFVNIKCNRSISTEIFLYISSNNMIYLIRNDIGIVAKFVVPSSLVYCDILCNMTDYSFLPCTVETMNDFINPYIVLYLKCILRASMRTIYFVWKVTIRLVINQNRLYCSAVWCWMLFLMHAHKQEGEAALTASGVWLNVALVRSQIKRCIELPEGLCLRETRRFAQMKCVVQQLCRWRKWLGFKMKSLM